MLREPPAPCPVYSEYSIHVATDCLVSLGCCLLLSIVGFLSINNYYLEPRLEMERV